MEVWKTAEFGDLRKDYEVGAVRLFVGAGVSSAAKLPTWRELVELLRDEVRNGEENEERAAEIQELLARGRYIDALSSAKQVLGAPRFVRVVQKTLDDEPVRELPPLLKAIGALTKARAALTTNLDRLLERALGWPAIERPKQDAASARAKVVKLHGTLLDPDTWILTRDEYDKAVHANGHLRALYAGLFHGGDRLLFIGYGLSDDDFDLRLADIRAWSGGGGQVPIHYALVLRNARGPQVRKQLRDAGVVLLEYDDKDGTHAGLFEALRQLGGPKQPEVAKIYATPWLDGPLTIGATIDPPSERVINAYPTGTPGAFLVFDIANKSDDEFAIDYVAIDVLEYKAVKVLALMHGAGATDLVMGFHGTLLPQTASVRAYYRGHLQGQYAKVLRGATDKFAVELTAPTPGLYRFRVAVTGSLGGLSHRVRIEPEGALVFFDKNHDYVVRGYEGYVGDRIIYYTEYMTRLSKSGASGKVMPGVPLLSDYVPKRSK
jgi:hypothetical protein